MAVLMFMNPYKRFIYVRNKPLGSEESKIKVAEFGFANKCQTGFTYNLFTQDHIQRGGGSGVTVNPMLYSSLKVC